VDIIAMDFKLPTSAQMGNLWGLHRKFLKIASRKEVFLKAVVCDSTEDEDLKQAVDLIREINRSAILVLQPNSFEKNHNLAKRLGNFKDICRKDGITTCVIPQMHKAIGIK
jgi:organic radical activating enzyme